MRSPSLSPRPIERLGFDEPERAPPAPAAADPALDAKLAETARSVEQREQRSRAALAAAERQVDRASGTAAGSDAWLDAHIALGELDGLRAEASEALSGLEQRAADRAVAGEPPYPALDQAIVRGRDALTQLSAQIAALGQRLAQP